MKLFPRGLSPFVAFVLASFPVLGAVETIFQDGFESGALGPQWSISTSNDGRATVTTNFNPASGQWHLVLDDAVDDVILSRTEATLQLDLRNWTAVWLTFRGKSLGNEPNYPDWQERDFDGVSVSNDGGNTWHLVSYELVTVSPEWTTISIDLRAFGVWDGVRNVFGPDLRIRISEFDNASAPLDGIAIDDVVVTGERDLRATVEIAGSHLEGSGPHLGYVLLSFTPTNTVTVSLSATPAGQLQIPATIQFPPGKTVASFNYSVIDDDRPNLTRKVSLEASAPGIRSIAGSVTLFDDDLPEITLELPPQLLEGDPVTSTLVVSVNPAAEAPMRLLLSQAPGNEVDLPYEITVPARQTRALFPVRAADDDRFDGSVPVTITASAPGFPPLTVTTETLDNEVPEIFLRLPYSVLEGATINGDVFISGSLATNLEVRLQSDNDSIVHVPPTLTIPAGQRYAWFTIEARENSSLDGLRKAKVEAFANGFPATNSSIAVADNDPAHYTLTGPTDIVAVDAQFYLLFQATDIRGETMWGLNRTATVSLVGSSGISIPMAPGVINVTDGQWNGLVNLPPVPYGQYRFRVSDAGGTLVESPLFEVMRFIPATVSDMVWDPGRGRIYASVPFDPSSTNSSRLLIIDPVGARVTGDLHLPQNPGPLALTSGGEYLYVGLSGSGTVARINPDTLAVESSFSIGTDPQDGAMSASDICTVRGNPDLLVVARKRLLNGYQDLAAYDHGIARPATTAIVSRGAFVEPSADPEVFLTLELSQGFNRVRRLRLNGSGLIDDGPGLDVSANLPDEFRSDGDTAFLASGEFWNASGTNGIESLPATGLVCPDLTNNRVIYAELTSTPLGWNYSLGAYQASTKSLVRKLSLPWFAGSPRRMIRWGANGLAMLDNNRVGLMESRRLIPSGVPADLLVTASSTPNPVFLQEPITHTVTISNQSLTVARGAVLVATLSEDQSVQSVASSSGTTVPGGNVVTLLAGDLNPGGSATLMVTTLPGTTAFASITANGYSGCDDPNLSDNGAVAGAQVGYHLSVDSLQTIRAGANNLVYDPGRNRLWLSIRDSGTPATGRVVAIDPATGLASNVIQFSGDPKSQCMSISTNGEYLYLGLTDSNEILRLHLAAPVSVLRIPLVFDGGTGSGTALDIEPLAGDGTSFLVVTHGSRVAVVFDGVVARTNRTASDTAGQIDPMTGLGRFSTYRTGGNAGVSILQVTPSGVVVAESGLNLISGAGWFHGSEDLLLANNGRLVDAANLILKADLGIAGAPCLDLTNERAYVFGFGLLNGFELPSLQPTPRYRLPDAWYYTAVRWGLDGFALTDYDGNIYVLRWSGTIPSGKDSNSDGISDAWEATFFGSLAVNPAGDDDHDGTPNFLEYLFGTSPVEESSEPLQVSAVQLPGGQPALRIVFPRRTGVPPSAYGFVVSADLTQWTPAQNVSQTVLSTQTVGGVPMETVEALIPTSSSFSSFVRFSWNP